MELQKYKLKSSTIVCKSNNKYSKVTAKYALIYNANCSNDQEQVYRQFEVTSCSNYFVCSKDVCSCMPITIKRKDF